MKSSRGLEKIQNALVEKGAIPYAATLTVQYMEPILSSNRYFAHGEPTRIHVNVAENGYVESASGTWNVKLPDHGKSAKARFTIKWTEGMERFKCSSKF